MVNWFEELKRMGPNGRLRTGEHRIIIEAGTFPRYAASGHILYALGSTIMAVEFDADRLEATGDPVPLVNRVMVKGTGAASFSVSKTGSLVYVTGGASSGLMSAIWVQRDGTEEPLPLDARSYLTPRVSPDGTRVAVSVADPNALAALWVFDVADGRGLRLTQGGLASNPVWTSNDRIAFMRGSAGTQEIRSVMADGGAEDELLLANESTIAGDFPTSVTTDGRYLIFTRLLTITHREIWQVALDGDPKPESVVQGEFARGNAEVSPDGRWLTYRSNESGEMEIYVRPYRGAGPVVPVSIGGGTRVTWSPDGSEIFYRRDDRMMAVPFSVEGRTPQLGSATELFRGPYLGNDAPAYHVAPDGRFLMLKEVGSEAGALPPRVVLVQNWLEELGQPIGQ